MTWVSQVSLLPIHLLRHLLICRQPKAFPRVLERQFRVQNTNGKSYHQRINGINLYQVPSAYSACAKAACVWYRLLQSVKVQILYQRLNTCWVLLLQNIVCVKIKDQLVALSVVGGFYPNSQTPFSSPPKSLPAHGPVQEKDYLARTFGARGPFRECEKSNDYSVDVWFMMHMVHLKSYQPLRQKPRWNNQNRSHRSILL